MPNWGEILKEINIAGNAHDIVRRKYLKRLNNITRRNVIAYYSGWLQKGDLQRRGLMTGFEINDADKNAFMSTIYKLDRRSGLDLILHTPGGDMAATESLVDYLRSMFGTDIRAIIPQIAMSGGTMIALACKEIIMGKHSSLGPIDPQLNGMPAHGIIEEFNQAAKEVASDQSKIPLWQMIFNKYSPTLIGECQKSIKLANQMVGQWLTDGMFNGNPDVGTKVDRVVKELSDHALTLSHARHLSYDFARNLGLKVVALEDQDNFQDAVLSVHHSFILTLDGTRAFKIVENHKGTAFILNVSQAIN
jgi:ATP-dependent protease ClpP protease subunit